MSDENFKGTVSPAPVSASGAAQAVPSGRLLPASAHTDLCFDITNFAPRHLQLVLRFEYMQAERCIFALLKDIRCKNVQ